MMINLFEYQNKIELPESLEGLEDFLEDIWRKRENNPSFFEDSSINEASSQKFLNFLHKSNELKSNKFIGVIHYNGVKINLLPKIFFKDNKEYSENEVCQIHNHIIWWLSYCRKINFPKFSTSLGATNNDFFEVLIYLFSKYTRDLLSVSAYHRYEEQNDELPYLKGQLNFNKYINRNVSSGNFHKLNCSYDAFVIDNEFNRIIKYVSGLLLSASKKSENKKYLREILFILDDVSDVKISAEQCDRITFNHLFRDFEIVLNYCKLFLENSISFDYKNNLKLFAFFLPMDYVFEDFIFGFIDKELETIIAKSQRSDVFLDKDKKFNLKPDLWIKTEHKNLIADTKYKIVYSGQKDPKNGISQNDLYQMLTYAIRFKVSEIILFYPDTIEYDQNEFAEIIIDVDSHENKEVLIRAFKLPIINYELLNKEYVPQNHLMQLFANTRIVLKQKLIDAFHIDL
jgi:5-methylcytosine-specific restriction enzyme subunit McrC